MLHDPSQNKHWRHWYRRCFQRHWFSDQWPFGEEMMVLCNVVNLGHELLASNGCWRHLSEVAEFLPAVAPAARAVAESLDDDEETGLDLRYIDCPWGWSDAPVRPRQNVHLERSFTSFASLDLTSHHFTSFHFISLHFTSLHFHMLHERLFPPSTTQNQHNTRTH